MKSTPSILSTFHTRVVYIYITEFKDKVCSVRLAFLDKILYQKLLLNSVKLLKLGQKSSINETVVIFSESTQIRTEK